MSWVNQTTGPYPNAVLPVIGAILAIIFGHTSARDARERGERPSAMATAGAILGWVGLIGPIATVALLFFTVLPWAVCVAIAVLIAAISVLVIYVRRDNRSRVWVKVGLYGCDLW
jgi:MFS family permease